LLKKGEKPEQTGGEDKKKWIRCKGWL